MSDGLEPGPLAPIADDELIWLGPSPPLATIVAADLVALDGADATLRGVADRLIHAGDIPDGGMGGDLSAVTGELVGIDGILYAEAFDHMGNGVTTYESELGWRAGDLPGEGHSPDRMDPQRPGDEFDAE